MMEYIFRRLVAVMFCVLCLEGFSQDLGCNIHCAFRYLGYAGIKDRNGFKESSFLDTPVYSHAVEATCPPFKELRTLDLELCRLEKAVSEDDAIGMTNAVVAVSRLLNRLSSGEGRDVMDCALEMVSFSVVRVIQGRAGHVFDMLALDRLLPASLLEATDMPRALKTFKRMIIVSEYVEKYRQAHGALPVNLDETEVPELYRKCAYGRDIEYDHMQGVWVLRCACDSWCGGLAFDEYLPGILSDRKKLPLFLSSSFAEKRRGLFSGNWMFLSDARLTCRVDHGSRDLTSGFHGLKYKCPGAGASRVTGIGRAGALKSVGAVEESIELDSTAKGDGSCGR